MSTRLGTVGVVTTSYPRRPGDAAGAFVAELLDALPHAPARIEVVAAGAADDDDDGGRVIARVPAPAGLFYAGGAPDALAVGGAARLLGAAGFGARLALTVARAARRGGWDAVITHWLAPSALAALPTRGPLLAIAHGGDVHLLARLGLLAPTMGLLRRRGARVVFVAEALRARAAAACTGATAAWVAGALVQPMGVDVTRFAAVPPPRAIADRRPALLVLARLVELKGVVVALDALAHLPPVRLIIAGDGPERAALAARAARVGGGHTVELVGQVDAAGRDALLAGADVVLVPSIERGGRSEGTPRVALEALAAGRPIAVSRTGGLAELPASSAIALAEPGHPDLLAAAIRQLLVAIGTGAAAAAAREVAAGYAWPEVARRLAAYWVTHSGPDADWIGAGATQFRSGEGASDA
ncbi:MAG: glycosyltransferase family 4 protein [Kofleriaceae bacterium]|nr:glycosyltransferase family 4 protein [Kofleriaceae bacterium]